MIEFISNYWGILLTCLVVGIAGGVVTYLVLSKPMDKQLSALKEWLKYAVTLSEKELGGGTGQLKLRMVYDLFVTKFPWLSKLISFDMFSTYVDEALEWLRGQLDSNAKISSYVNEDETK